MNVSKMMKRGAAIACAAAAISYVADHISKCGSTTPREVVPPVMTAMQGDGFLRILWAFPMSEHIVGYSVRLDTSTIVRRVRCRHPELLVVSPTCSAGCVCVEEFKEITVVAYYDNGTAAEISKRLDEADEPEQPEAPEKGGSE